MAKLLDNIVKIVETQGISSVLCIETGCTRNTTLQTGGKLYGRTNCMEQLPYIVDTPVKLHIIELCTYKVNEFMYK